MRGSTAARFVVWGTTLAALATLVVMATGMTGAYFSDTHHGTISGNIGSIKVETAGGGGVSGNDFTFANLLPGERQTATIQFLNSGRNAEDVWLVFNNATALSTLNNLGTYGEAHVSNAQQELFASTNLNDRAATCGAFSPAGCWPLPSKLKVADNLAPGSGGYVKFSFNYAGKLSSPDAEGKPFNAYPVPGGAYPTNPQGQATVNSSDGHGTGLPYEIVATQVGQTP